MARLEAKESAGYVFMGVAKAEEEAQQ